MVIPAVQTLTVQNFPRNSHAVSEYIRNGVKQVQAAIRQLGKKSTLAEFMTLLKILDDLETMGNTANSFIPDTDFSADAELATAALTRILRSKKIHKFVKQRAVDSQSQEVLTLLQQRAIKVGFGLNSRLKVAVDALQKSKARHAQTVTTVAANTRKKVFIKLSPERVAKEDPDLLKKYLTDEGEAEIPWAATSQMIALANEQDLRLDIARARASVSTDEMKQLFIDLVRITTAEAALRGMSTHELLLEGTGMTPDQVFSLLETYGEATKAAVEAELGDLKQKFGLADIYGADAEFLNMHRDENGADNDFPEISVDEYLSALRVGVEAMFPFEIKADSIEFDFADRMTVWKFFHNGKLVGDVVLDIYHREGCQSGYIIPLQGSKAGPMLIWLALGYKPELKMTKQEIKKAAHEMGHIIQMIAPFCNEELKYPEARILTYDMVSVEAHSTAFEIFGLHETIANALRVKPVKPTGTGIALTHIGHFITAETYFRVFGIPNPTIADLDRIYEEVRAKYSPFAIPGFGSSQWSFPHAVEASGSGLFFAYLMAAILQAAFMNATPEQFYEFASQGKSVHISITELVAKYFGIVTKEQFVQFLAS